MVFEKVVEHIDLETKECPICHSTVKAKAPKDMPGPLQYGNGIKAYIINLLVCHMVALKRTQNLVKSMIGCIIAEATMLKFILRLDQTLADWEAHAMTELLKTKAINVDETSLRVDKKNHWIHTYSSGDITLKFLHRKRGKIAKSDAHNLWERLKEHESAVLLFAKDPYVSFTNNRAERDLRMAKVKQKISGCFRAEIYAKAYCRISSYLQTMANKGINPLIAIQMALSGKITEHSQ